MKRPVFVVGCPRSGTTLLYSMLVASGGFAFYRKETYFYDLEARFPHLTSPRSRQEFLDKFLAGYLGRVPGLDVAPIAQKAVAECETTSEFLPRLMTAITEEQGMERWIEGTPVHVLYMDRIAQAVPDALFVHVIRDGRDCALSTDRQGWAPAVAVGREPACRRRGPVLGVDGQIGPAVRTHASADLYGSALRAADRRSASGAG